MSEEAEKITPEVIEEVNKEIEATETKAVEEKVSDAKGQIESDYKAQLEELQKSFDAKLTEMNDGHKKELEERDGKMETLKNDFDKQIESISLRKSVSVNDVKDEVQVKQNYKELSPEEKSDADKAYFREIGIPGF